MSESIYEFLWYVNNIMLALLQGGFLILSELSAVKRHLLEANGVIELRLRRTTPDALRFDIDLVVTDKDNATLSPRLNVGTIVAVKAGLHNVPLVVGAFSLSLSHNAERVFCNVVDVVQVHRVDILAHFAFRNHAGVGIRIEVDAVTNVFVLRITESVSLSPLESRPVKRRIQHRPRFTGEVER